MMNDNELRAYARHLGVSFPLLKDTAEKGRLPVVNFAAGGIGKIQGVLPNMTVGIYFALKWILQ